MQDQSKKQTAVSHSTPEAEIVAIDHALRTVGLPALQLWDILFQRTKTLYVHEDNAACIQVMKTVRSDKAKRARSKDLRKKTPKHSKKTAVKGAPCP